MNADEMSSDTTLAKKLYLPWAKKLVTGAVAYGISLRTGPDGVPVALLLSTTFTSIVDMVYREFESRVLSPREKFKTDLVFVTALKEIESRIDGGASLRDDGFFTYATDGRTKAEEILEGVILKARDQYEEKKLPHFGAFFGRIGYSNVSPALANYLLNAGEGLSYRQFLLLAHVLRVKTFAGEPLRGRKHTLAELHSFVTEEMMLVDKAEFGGVGLLKTLGSYNSEVSEMGKEFVDLFAIDNIPNHELVEIRRLIARCQEDPVTA